MERAGCDAHAACAGCLIVVNGVQALGKKIDGPANQFIATLSQGLPHYTHLLGLHASRQAIDNDAKVVRVGHVDGAIRKAIDGAQQTLQRAYHKATISPPRHWRRGKSSWPVPSPTPINSAISPRSMCVRR